MSRRSVPRIQPVDLRDVASEERVERIWSRLDQDLATVRARPPSRGSRAVVWAAAATIAAFGVGIGVGRLSSGAGASNPSAVVATNDRATVDVFAAGSQERTYALPGGGSITLQPGAMIELEHGAGGDLRLRLLSGEASFDAAKGALAIVSGEATVATAPGSLVRVQKREDNLDVRVTSGSAQVSSPAGTRDLRMGEQMDGVPTRTTTAVVPPPVVRVSPLPSSRAARNDAPVAQVAVAPSWRDHYAASRYDEALELLKQQPGGIATAVENAKSADELMAIREIASSRGKGDAQAAFRALHRVADEFGSSSYGPIAALKLADHYQSAGLSDLAKKYGDQAAKGVLGEDAMCRQMRAEHAAGNKDEAEKRAKEYLDKHPNGRCKDEANRILQGGDADGEGEPTEPADPPASGTTSAAPGSAAPPVQTAPSAAPPAKP